MTEFISLFGPLVDPIPDDISVAQFILDRDHPRRPVRPTDTAWLIDDATGRKVFYEELRERTHGLANALHHKYAFGNDDIACIFSPNDVDYPVAVWAAHRLGGAVSTANPSYTIDEFVHQLTAVKPAILLTDPAVLSTALEAARKVGLPANRVILFRRIADSPSSMVSLDELIAHGLSSTAPPFVEHHMAPGEAKSKVAFYCFSSGTTGAPKAVAIAHYALIANVIQQAVMTRVGEANIPKDEQRYRPGDIASGILPLFHIYGLVANLHAMLFYGMSVVLIPKFNFEGFLKSIVRFQMTHILLVPPMVVLLCKRSAVQKYDLSSVRGVSSGAAPLSAEILPLLTALLPRATISQGYGMTETATVVSTLRFGERRTRGGSGALLPGVRARVVKADGSLAKVGETGELVVTGPSMALGYANNAQATGETFVDGWVRTGDEVRFDEQGELWIVDRLKELIKVRGFQVAPSELEGHLLDHPAVADACVVPVPDEYSGELPLAFVVPHASFADKIRADPQEAERVKAELLAHVADAKSRYKWLAGGVEFVDKIPKTPSGKLLRRVLRERARELHKAASDMERVTNARVAMTAQPPCRLNVNEQVVLSSNAI
ncbi:amp dependent CoA ligase [Athelia psychrophila]|uniref:Amp dependent CoA ligase n=1 Tax=Athelia psychrophila TaxID=1759441 RepID=A0A167XEI4_9AGAM|nr:amp dependent CoA ligase [Fibularhizoctonia sp. CBS 109695]